MAAPAEWLRRASLADRAAIEQVQAAAYADTAATIGRTPMPLEWDYGVVLSEWDVWLSEDDQGVTGVLILHLRPDDLYLESIAVHPRGRGTGLGSRLLAATDAAALAAGRSIVRLLTNGKNIDRIALYERRGYAIEFVEEIDDRRIVHMIKHLAKS